MSLSGRVAVCVDVVVVEDLRVPSYLISDRTILWASHHHSHHDLPGVNGQIRVVE